MAEDGTFSVIQAKRGGRDAIIVVDGALDPQQWSASFPWLVTTRMPIRQPNRHGLCDDHESERLGDVEDRLLNMLESDAYHYAGRITWNGTREVLIYASEPDETASRLRAAAASMNLAAEVTTEHEPDWSTFRMLVRPLR